MMTSASVKPQDGVCAEPSIHSWTLLLDVISDDVSGLRKQLQRFPQFVDSLSGRFSEANLSVVLAVGANYWDVLTDSEMSARPRSLRSLPLMHHAEFSLPETHADFAIICRADRMDANYFAARVLLEWLAPFVSVQEEVQGFRYLDGRDLFGFRLDPDMLHGQQRRDFVFVDSRDDNEFAGGSYLFVQRLLLDLKRWEQLSLGQQRELMGREKVSGQPWPTEQANHAEKAERGELAIWRVQMPIASVQRGGELILHWSRDQQELERYLQRRYGSDGSGSADPLLAYQTTLQGAIFFAPSRQWFERLS